MAFKMKVAVGTSRRQYTERDPRLNKPVCHQEFSGEDLAAELLLQEADELRIDGKRALYFCPNNIGMLLTVSKTNAESARQLYNCQLLPNLSNTPLNDVSHFEFRKLFSNSKLVCDFLQYVQISLVFGYTALEAFANLSIPQNHSITKQTPKGIREIYDKNAIDRWISLKEKIKDILPGIYNAPAVKNQDWWPRFCRLEEMRHDIIHQKSINHTELFEQYFKKSIFSICFCPEFVIKHFYKTHLQNNKTNPIWPWLEGEEPVFPLNAVRDKNIFEHLDGNDDSMDWI
jgi:hypothetical protein